MTSRWNLRPDRSGRARWLGHSGTPLRTRILHRRRQCTRTPDVRLAARYFFNSPLSYTTRPPTTVRNTFVPEIRSGGTVATSRSRTMRSANFPTSSEPMYCSSCSSYAALRVIAWITAACDRPGSCPRRPEYWGGSSGPPLRVTPTCNANHSFSGSTGQSLPYAIRAPFSASQPAGSTSGQRRGPSESRTASTVSPAGFPTGRTGPV